jgi:hypothetical protein
MSSGKTEVIALNPQPSEDKTKQYLMRYLVAGLRNPYFPENDEGFLLPAGALLRRAYLCLVQVLSGRDARFKSR